MISKLPERPGFPVGLWEALGFSNPLVIDGPFWGFSGQPTWKIQNSQGSWALKRLRLSDQGFVARQQTHRLVVELIERFSLPLAQPANKSLVQTGSWHWECLSWCPGTVADLNGAAPFVSVQEFGQRTSQVLGRLHRGLAQLRKSSTRRFQDCPSVVQRKLFLDRFLQTGPPKTPGFPGFENQFLDGKGDRWFLCGKDILKRLSGDIGSVLSQIVHGDPHPGNWLGNGQEITGLIDFVDGAVGEPRELDLARLWGGLDDQGGQWQQWLEAYDGHGGEPSVSLERIRLLEASGVWVRVHRWLEALHNPVFGQPGVEVPVAVQLRLKRLGESARYWLKQMGYG